MLRYTRYSPGTILHDLMDMSIRSCYGDAYNTAISGLVSDFFDYGLAIEAKLCYSRVDFVVTFSAIVNNLGYGIEGMKDPF